MTRPRSCLVSVEDTLYYHCIGRCVRRAFLCGQDTLSGRNFDHRKALVAERLARLTEVFAIELCAYALMSNHYHLVVRLIPERAARWDDAEVVTRWRKLFTGPACIDRYLAGETLLDHERELIATNVPRWRARLADLSWFMRCLNEHIARLANAEDGCTGRFWEGRFKSQALLDETALLSAMAYVDLNPVRAGLATTIADSAHTSGQQRLAEVVAGPLEIVPKAKPRLAPFAGALRYETVESLPFNLQDYLDLLDSTGRVMHPDKRGAILETSPRLLSILGVAPADWLTSVAELHVRFGLFIGAPHRLSALAARRGWRWIRGQAAARRLYRCLNE
jgi:REP element-mobilizing transposase RayT